MMKSLEPLPPFMSRLTSFSAPVPQSASEKANRVLEQQASEASGKLDEANRTLNDFETAKKKLTLENADYTRQVSNSDTTTAI